MKRFENWKKPYIDENGWAYPDYFSAPRNQSFGWRCQHSLNLIIKKYVDVGCFTYMNAKYGITIGENTQIGSHCSIYSHDTENNIEGPVLIGKNCLIGSHTTILPNSIIPDDTKIPAYSLVRPINGETKIKKMKREWNDL